MLKILTQRILISTILVAFMVLFINNTAVEASLIANYSDAFEVGDGWGEPILVQNKSTNISSAYVFGKLNVKQYVYAAQSDEGEEYFLIVNVTDIIPNKDLKDSTSFDAIKVEDVTFTLDYCATCYSVVQQNHQTTYGSTSYSTNFGIGYDKDGLGLDISVSASREHLELRYYPSYNPVTGNYTNRSDYSKNKDNTLTLVDAVVLLKTMSNNKIQFTSNTEGRIEYLTDTQIIWSDVEDDVDINVLKYVYYDNFINYEVEHTPSELVDATYGDWIKYEENVGFQDAVTVYDGAIFAVDRSVYRYDYKGEQYFLIKFDTKNKGHSSGKTSVESMVINVSFPGNVDLVGWSPRSEISSQAHGISLSLSTWSIKASASNSYSVSDLDITDHGDTVSDVLTIEFDYDNDVQYLDNVQSIFILVKDLDSDYKVDMNYEITTHFRDRYGFLNLGIRHSYLTEEDSITINAQSLSNPNPVKYDEAELRIDDNVEINENIFIQANEKRRLIFRAIDTGTVEVETSKWNTYTDTYVTIYDQYGTVVASDNNSGFFSFSKVQFEAIANRAYFVEVKRYGSTASIDCNVAIRYIDLSTPDHWAASGTYDEQFIHFSANDKPIVVETYPANTFTVETMAHSSYTGYYDTYVSIYDQYGNLITKNDDGGYSLYSKVTGLNMEANSRFFVMIRGYSAYNNLGYRIKITK